MPAIALRVPTVAPEQPNLPGGHCYILFPEPTITARELIGEKVRAELRKARAGGPHTSSIDLLLPEATQIGTTPLDEQLAVAQACRAFVSGHFLLLCDGRPLVDLDERLTLTRRTGLVFLCHNLKAAEQRLRDAA